MSPVTRAAALLVFLSLAAIGAGCYWMLQTSADIRAEAALAHARLNDTLSDCQAALHAVNLAIAQREEVYARHAKHLAELDAALADADAYCIPRSLREFYARHASPDAAPTAGASRPDPDPAQK